MARDRRQSVLDDEAHLVSEFFPGHYISPSEPLRIPYRSRAFYLITQSTLAICHR